MSLINGLSDAEESSFILDEAENASGLNLNEMKDAD